MKPRFREQDIEPALIEFARRCATALNAVGIPAEFGAGQFKLVLEDVPILAKDDLRKRHGRCWFKRKEWQTSYWPHSDSPGVYLFFDRTGMACYVGKAERAIGLRAAKHVGPAGLEGMYQLSKFPDAEYLVVVPFDGAAFLAPAFESFLLEEYDFPSNVMLAGKPLREST